MAVLALTKPMLGLFTIMLLLVQKLK